MSRFGESWGWNVLGKQSKREKERWRTMDEKKKQNKKVLNYLSSRKLALFSFLYIYICSNLEYSLFSRDYAQTTTQINLSHLAETKHTSRTPFFSRSYQEVLLNSLISQHPACFRGSTVCTTEAKICDVIVSNFL